MQSSMLNYLKITAADRSAYDELSHLHYRGDALGPVRYIFAIRDEHPARKFECPVVGVIVYGMPAANLGIRNIATGGAFTKFDRAAGLAVLNSQMLTIRRVIIEPRYRGLGLAAKLVKETMPLTGARMIEAIAAMGLAHPFFARAGMKEFTPAPDAKTERMRAAFEAVGINNNTGYLDAAAVYNDIEHLANKHKTFIKDEMDRFMQKFTSGREKKRSIERTEFILSKLSCRVRYYLWVNPGQSKNIQML